MQSIGTIRLSDYAPSAVSQQATVQTTEQAPSTVAPVTPLNGTAFAIALLIGLLALAGAYLILKRMS